MQVPRERRYHIQSERGGGITVFWIDIDPFPDLHHWRIVTLMSRILASMSWGESQMLSRKRHLNPYLSTTRSYTICRRSLHTPLIICWFLSPMCPPPGPCFVTHPNSRGRNHAHYSATAITLRYIFALSYNSLTPWINVITCIVYRFEHIGAIIASYSYRSRLRDQHYCFY